MLQSTRSLVVTAILLGASVGSAIAVAEMPGRSSAQTPPTPSATRTAPPTPTGQPTVVPGAEGPPSYRQMVGELWQRAFYLDFLFQRISGEAPACSAGVECLRDDSQEALDRLVSAACSDVAAAGASALSLGSEAEVKMLEAQARATCDGFLSAVSQLGKPSPASTAWRRDASLWHAALEPVLESSKLRLPENQSTSAHP